MHTALLLLAQGRGDEADGGVGILLIIAFILLAAATIGAVVAMVIRRSRRADERLGPDREPHEPGHGGRVSGMEQDRVER